MVSSLKCIALVVARGRMWWLLPDADLFKPGIIRERISQQREGILVEGWRNHHGLCIKVLVRQRSLLVGNLHQCFLTCGAVIGSRTLAYERDHDIALPLQYSTYACLSDTIRLILIRSRNTTPLQVPIILSPCMQAQMLLDTLHQRLPGSAYLRMVKSICRVRLCLAKKASLLVVNGLRGGDDHCAHPAIDSLNPLKKLLFPKRMFWHQDEMRRISSIALTKGRG